MTHNNNNIIIDKREPITPPGAIPVPNISESPVLLSPAQTPQFNIVSKPQVVHVAPAPAPTLSGQIGTNPGIDQEDIYAKESVGSILQRIASFSKVETPVPNARPIIPLSNGVNKDSPSVLPKELKRSEGKLYLSLTF